MRQGDDVLARLRTLMVDEDIPSAMLSGFGFAGQITFGFFDFEAREYKPKSFENLEVTNLTGSLAWKDGKPLPHLHATAGSASFEAVGGHLLALEVGRDFDGAPCDDPERSARTDHRRVDWRQHPATRTGRF